jgi:serine/threonine protein kinase
MRVSNQDWGGSLVLATRDEKVLLGTVWCERYQILEVVGRGGMGTVYKARHLQIGREVALKVIHRRLCSDEKQVQRFEAEARTSSLLSHPNSIRVFDYGTSADGRLFMAMELLNGQTLQALLAKEGKLDAQRAAHIARQVLKALGEAHEKGLVHRDLKPENIFVCDVHGERDFVKVLDFGIAKAVGFDKDQAHLTQTGFICGTPRYISPEQALGHQVDGRTDLYAVGVLLYEMLSGRPPFLGDSPISIVMGHVYDDPPPVTEVDTTSHLARRLLALLEAAMRKSPPSRPASAEWMIACLDGKADIASLGAEVAVQVEAAPAPPEPQIEAPDSDADTLTLHRQASAPPEPKRAPRPQPEAAEITVIGRSPQTLKMEGEESTGVIPSVGRGAAPPAPVSTPPSLSLSGRRPRQPMRRVAVVGGLSLVAVALCSLGAWLVAGPTTSDEPKPEAVTSAQEPAAPPAPAPAPAPRPTPPAGTPAPALAPAPTTAGLTAGTALGRLTGPAAEPGKPVEATEAKPVLAPEGAAPPLPGTPAPLTAKTPPAPREAKPPKAETKNKPSTSKPAFDPF